MAENKSIIYYMSQFESPAIAKFPDHCILNSGIAKLGCARVDLSCPISQ